MVLDKDREDFIDPMIDFDNFKILSDYVTNYVFMSKYRISKVLKMK